MRLNQVGRTNERGRTILEMVMVIGLMGVISLAVLYGYALAQRKEAAARLTDLVNKSVAGVVTSQVLDRLAEEYEGEPASTLEIDEALAIPVYISNVEQVESGSEEAALYGEESFHAPMGTIISAHALKSGRGVVVKANQFPTSICEHVLTSGLMYEAVWDFGSDRVYHWETIKDTPEVIKDICDGEAEDAQGLKNVLNIGFVFENTGINWDTVPPAGCNEKCTVEVLGECGVTTRKECTGACERKYFNTKNCEWNCYDGQGADCTCSGSKVWDEEEKKCVACLSNADCPEDTPVCDNPGVESECVSCPSETIYNGTECVDCAILTNNERPFYHITKEGQEECVKCIKDIDCLHPTPVCLSDNTCGCEGQSDCAENETCDVTNKVCTACAEGLVGQVDNTCGCSDGTYPHPTEANTCVACTDDTHCATNTTGKTRCNTTTYTCDCPTGLTWDNVGNTCCPTGSVWDTAYNACIAEVMVAASQNARPVSHGCSKYCSITLTFPETIKSGKWVPVDATQQFRIFLNVLGQRSRYCSPFEAEYILTNQTIDLTNEEIFGDRHSRVQGCWNGRQGPGQYLDFVESLTNNVLTLSGATHTRCGNSIFASTAEVYQPTFKVKYIGE